MSPLTVFAPCGAGDLQLLGVEGDDLQAGAHCEQVELAPGSFSLPAFDYDSGFQHRGGGDQAAFVGDNGFQIVGICEKKFTGTEPGTFVDIFLPTMMDHNVTRDDTTWIRTLTLLQPGVAPEALRQKLAAVSHAFEAKRLSGETGLSAETLKNVLANQVLMTPAPNGASIMQQDYTRALMALGALVFMVLLIACANVANLMTAQAAARAREMALRVSIGAGRGRLIQMVLIEGALLAAFAAIGGALFAWWSAPFVVISMARHSKSQSSSFPPSTTACEGWSSFTRQLNRRTTVRVG